MSKLKNWVFSLGFLGREKLAFYKNLKSTSMSECRGKSKATIFFSKTSTEGISSLKKKMKERKKVNDYEPLLSPFSPPNFALF